MAQRHETFIAALGFLCDRALSLAEEDRSSRLSDHRQGLYFACGGNNVRRGYLRLRCPNTYVVQGAEILDVQVPLDGLSQRMMTNRRLEQAVMRRAFLPTPMTTPAIALDRGVAIRAWPSEIRTPNTHPSMTTGQNYCVTGIEKPRPKPVLQVLSKTGICWPIS
jgi:hypothetical protein